MYTKEICVTHQQVQQTHLLPIVFSAKQLSFMCYYICPLHNIKSYTQHRCRSKDRFTRSPISECFERENEQILGFLFFLFDILHLENTLIESCIEIIKIQDANFFQHDLNKVDVRLAYHAVLLSTPPPLFYNRAVRIKSVVCVSSDGE